MSPAMSQMILTDSDAFLLLWWFEAVVLLEASTLLLLPPTVHMKRCRKVSLCFHPSLCYFLTTFIPYFVLLFYFSGPRRQRAHKQRLSGSVSPTQRWKYNAAA